MPTEPIEGCPDRTEIYTVGTYVRVVDEHNDAGETGIITEQMLQQDAYVVMMDDSPNPHFYFYGDVVEVPSK